MLRRITDHPIFNWLFYGHLWIALGAVAMGWWTLRVLTELRGNISQLAFLFFATLGVYTLHRQLSFRRVNGVPAGRRYRIAREQAGLSVGTGAFALGVAGVLLLRYPWQSWWPLLPAAPLTVWYLTPLRRGGRRGRDLPYVKVIWVALAWTLVTGLFPAVTARYVPPSWSGPPPIDWSQETLYIGLHLAGLFYYTLAVALLFDFRDTGLDRRQGVRTVANTHPNVAKWLAGGGFLISGVCWSLIDRTVFLPVALTTAVCLLVVRRTREDRSEDYYATVVNGLLLLPAVMDWMLSWR